MDKQGKGKTPDQHAEWRRRTQQLQQDTHAAWDGNRAHWLNYDQVQHHRRFVSAASRAAGDRSLAPTPQPSVVQHSPDIDDCPELVSDGDDPPSFFGGIGYKLGDTPPTKADQPANSNKGYSKGATTNLDQPRDLWKPKADDPAESSSLGKGKGKDKGDFVARDSDEQFCGKVMHLIADHLSGQNNNATTRALITSYVVSEK